MYSFSLFLLLFAVVSCEDSRSINVFNSVYNSQSICSVFKFASISENCIAQLTEACRNETVLWTMVDATSKFPYTGLQTATNKDLGGFDECVAIDHSYDGGRILGKHCLYGLFVPDLTASDFNNTDNYYKLSPCIPDACSIQDYNQLFADIFNSVNITQVPFMFVNYSCSTKEAPPFTAGDYTTVAILAACLFFMITSTLYDIYLMKYEKKSAHPLYLAFSVLSNGRKLMQTRENGSKELILMFQGLRVFYMMWVVAGHGYQGQDTYTVINDDSLKTAHDHFYVFYIQSAMFSIHSFFFISGFLMAYQYLKDKSKTVKRQIKAVPLMILYRYLRITPASLMLWLVMTYLFAHLGTGPLYAISSYRFHKTCTENWFSYFFYFQNYYNYDDMCIIPTWYISADMQMFIIALVILIPAAAYLKKGKFKQCMIGLLIVSAFFTFLPVVMKIPFDSDNEYGIDSSAIGFIIGIIMGAYLREKGNKPFLQGKFTETTATIINLVGWCFALSISIAALLLFQYVQMYGTHDQKIWFHSLAVPVWVSCHAWMLYSCYHGRGGIFNTFLSLPIFQVLARLTYTMYLCHGLVIAHYMSRIRVRMFLDDYNAFMIWCGYLLMTCLVAFVWTLAFESPMITISKQILGKFEGAPKRAPDEKKVLSEKV